MVGNFRSSRVPLKGGVRDIRICRDLKLGLPRWGGSP